MTIKAKVVPIVADNRDRGKLYLITEMDAFRAEKWGWRAMFAIAKHVDIPADVIALGMQGLRRVGMQAFFKADWYDTEPLLDELLSCASFVPDPAKINANPELPPSTPTSVGLDGHVQEPTTLFTLRLEAFDLHTGFSTAGVLRSWTSA